MAASLVTTMVVVRILSKEQVGAFFLVMLITQFAASMGDFGLRNTCIKFLSEGDEDEIASLSAYFWTLNVVFAAFSCAILGVTLPLLFRIWPSAEFQGVAWYCVPITFLQIIFQMALSILISYKFFRTLSVSSFVVEIVRMVISIILLVLGYGVQGLLLSMIIARILIIGIIWLKAPYCMKINLKHKRGKEFLVFGGWLQGASIVSYLNIRMVDAILTTHLGTRVLAVYSTAMQIPNALQRVFESIRPVLLGYISSLRADVANRVVIEARFLTGLLSVVVIFLVALARPMILLVFSSRYEESIPIMQALCVWMAIGIGNYFLTIMLTGSGQSKKVFLQTIPQFFIMLVCSLIFVPIYKGMGAAISLIITAVFGNLFCCWMVAEGNFKMFTKFSWIFISSSAILLAMLFFSIKQPYLVSNLLALPVAISLLFWIKVITREDIILFSHIFINGNNFLERDEAKIVNQNLGE